MNETRLRLPWLLSGIPIFPFAGSIHRAALALVLPMMKHGLDVNLPQTTAKAIKTDDERLVITIKKDGKIFVDDFETDLATLQTKLEQVYRNRPDKEALLHADASLEYGYVVKVMNEVRKAGVAKLGMVTEPVEKDEKKEKK